MTRLALLVAVSLTITACGSTHHAAAPAGPSRPGPGKVIYQGSAWAVVLDGRQATAEHLVGGRWVADRSGAVRVTILGPKPGSKQPATMQVAAALAAKSDLAESALWVDGSELLEKGGGLTPTKGTIYGAPAQPLAPGEHVAIAYARTATHGTAVAWTFRV